MKTINIEGTKRECLNKQALKKLRLSGQVPCVIYNNKTHVLFNTSIKNFKHLIYTPEIAKVMIKVENDQFETIIKDVQFSPVEDHIIHVDFYRLDPSKKVEMQVPIRITGRSIGVSKGGALATPLRKLKVKAFPDQIPDFIEIDISKLEIGNKITVKSIRNDLYEILHADNIVVVAVNASRESLKSAQEAKANEKEKKKK